MKTNFSPVFLLQKYNIAAAFRKGDAPFPAEDHETEKTAVLKPERFPCEGRPAANQHAHALTR